MHVGLQLSLPATPALLGETRRTLRGYMVAMGVDREVVADVVLAVDEACANVIRHAAATPEESYQLRAELTARSIVVSIADHGPGFDPEAVVDPPLEAVAGRGLQIIEQLMSSVEIDSCEGTGTRLSMERLLTPS